MKTSRLLDLTIYISIGIALVLLVYWSTFHFGPNNEPIEKWGGLAVTTLILFGYAVRDHWNYRKRRLFWLVAFILATVHVSIFSIILVKVEGWKVLWFVFAFPFENVMIDAAFRFTGHKKGSKPAWKP
ncbi:MAG: hypothetical protein LLG20_20955 [Acidobacteriales bacterium]|nr:hypothetical protein [Terriglobales bacterium]